MKNEEKKIVKLHEIVKIGRLKAVEKELKKEGVNVNERDEYDNIALHYAVARGYLDIVKLLLNEGSDINACNNCGNTPLHQAVKSNNYEVVEELLERGANFNLRNNIDYKAPLYLTNDDDIACLIMRYMQKGSIGDGWEEIKEDSIKNEWEVVRGDSSEYQWERVEKVSSENSLEESPSNNISAKNNTKLAFRDFSNCVIS